MSLLLLYQHKQSPYGESKHMLTNVE